MTGGWAGLSDKRVVTATQYSLLARKSQTERLVKLRSEGIYERERENQTRGKTTGWGGGGGGQNPKVKSGQGES